MKIIHLPRLLTIALLCSLAVHTAAQEQPYSGQANNQASDNNNDREKGAAQSAQEDIQSSPRGNNPSLELGVGDLIELTVYEVPELTTKTRISGTGEIYCPLIGPTYVAGLTAEKAARLIEKRLSAFQKAPYVSLASNARQTKNC